MQIPANIRGLDGKLVSQSRAAHGSNRLETAEEAVLGKVILEIIREPMFILLLLACIIYFSVGDIQEALLMLVAIILVAGISFYQDYRSRNAVQALNKLSAPKATVIRDGKSIRIPAEELVVGDLMMLEEGQLVPADGRIVSANDLSLNESILTGESFPVHKSADGSAMLYKGTLVTSGVAAVQVTEVGGSTMFGKIGLALLEIKVEKTPLQLQIRSFVKKMVWVGAVAFLLLLIFKYRESGSWLLALMAGLTLAMSILPEEIPVAFSTFQALGAYRLLRNKIIVKQPQYVETLGSATVICTDKTGTLTQNSMEIRYLYDAAGRTNFPVQEGGSLPASLIEYAMWSSESNPFDPMEKAIHALYAKTSVVDLRPRFTQVHEYPVSGKPPMMTHVFQDEGGQTIIAAKGAPEAILRQTSLTGSDLEFYEQQAVAFARRGYRVLGVGKGHWRESHWPHSQEEFELEFLGLLVFEDPPKEKMKETIREFHQAGIDVKMITGDYAETALAIADEVGLNHDRRIMTGNEVLKLSGEELRDQVSQVSIFARMFPEAKLKVIEALKEAGQVVAMTGDGVNDGPALKAAHIGIAMGQRGSEVARNAASLILLDDDLAHMTEAVALGRKIYDNLRKAVRYIVSIHIPIILVVLLPAILGWTINNLFTPVHVIFLELIMGPTCSIIFENEPMEPGTMQRPPRRMSLTFLSFKELSISILQGLAITAGCLGWGYFLMTQGAGEETVRSAVFISLLFSNILLTLVNRSFRYSLFSTLKYKNRLVPLVISLTILFMALILVIPALNRLFLLTRLSYHYLLISFLVALVATGWIEIWKFFRRKNLKS